MPGRPRPEPVEGQGPTARLCRADSQSQKCREICQRSQRSHLKHITRGGREWDCRSVRPFEPTKANGMEMTATSKPSDEAHFATKSGKRRVG
jgi:hypothetical protein